VGQAPLYVRLGELSNKSAGGKLLKSMKMFQSLSMYMGGLRGILQRIYYSPISLVDLEF
jgi:hypothetical protein